MLIVYFINCTHENIYNDVIKVFSSLILPHLKGTKYCPTDIEGVLK